MSKEALEASYTRAGRCYLFQDSLRFDSETVSVTIPVAYSVRYRRSANDTVDELVPSQNDHIEKGGTAIGTVWLLTDIVFSISSKGSLR